MSKRIVLMPGNFLTSNVFNNRPNPKNVKVSQEIIDREIEKLKVEYEIQNVEKKVDADGNEFYSINVLPKKL